MEINKNNYGSTMIIIIQYTTVVVGAFIIMMEFMSIRKGILYLPPSLVDLVYHISSGCENKKYKE